jgi:hypothetical protein
MLSYAATLYLNKYAMSIKYIIIISLVILAGCTIENRTIVFNRTEKAITAELENSPFLGLPIVLKHYKNRLIISDYHGDPLITVFDIQSDSVTSQMIGKGMGPGEALPPLSVSFAGDSMLLYTKSVYRAGYYALSDIDMPEKTSVKFSQPIPNIIFDVTCLPGNNLLATGFFEHGHYAIINVQGETIREFGNYPAFAANEKDYPYQAKALFHQVVLFEAHPNRHKIACVSSHVLEIINCRTTFLVTASISLAPYQYTYAVNDNYISVKKTPDTSRGAISVTSTNDFIYILIDSDKEDEVNGGNEIWVFDWNGEPVKKVLVDRNICLITAISDMLMYAITNPDYTIIKLSV